MKVAEFYTNVSVRYIIFMGSGKVISGCAKEDKELVLGKRSLREPLSDVFDLLEMEILRQSRVADIAKDGAQVPSELFMFNDDLSDVINRKILSYMSAENLEFLRMQLYESLNFHRLT